MTEAALQTLCKGTLDIKEGMVTLFYEFKSYITNIFILMQIEEHLCEYGYKKPLPEQYVALQYTLQQTMCHFC